MDSSAASIHHFNLWQIHHPALQSCTPRTPPAYTTRCSLQVRKNHTISISTSVATNAWLITSAPSTVMTGMTLVCPEGPTKLLTLWKPIHILQLPSACSATSLYFYLPPHYDPTTITLNISLEVVNLNMMNISALGFCISQHLENHQNETQLQHLASIPLFQSISSTNT